MDSPEEQKIPAETRADADADRFTVDLSREDFIAYNMRLSRISGPLRLQGIQLGSALLMAALCLCLAVYEQLHGEPTDWLMLVGALLLAGIGLASFFGMPAFLRRSFGKTYDLTMKSGCRYYGEIRIYDDRIEKQGQDGTVSVRLDGTAFFVEDAAQMLIVNTARCAMVLPARFLTADSADAIRRRVEEHLPMGNRKFIARVQPGGQTPVPPAANPADEPLWQETIRYTPEEFVTLAKHTAVAGFWKQLPQLSLISVLAALVLGWSEETPYVAVLYFLGTLALLCVLNLVLPLSRIRNSAPMLEGENLHVRIRISRNGVRVSRSRQGTMGMPWEAIRHVVDGGDKVEIYNNRQYVAIPKRCIEDFDAFSAMIDDCKKTNSKEM